MGGTGFVVVVQTRYDAAAPLAWGATLIGIPFVAGALAFAMLRFAGRRRRG